MEDRGDIQESPGGISCLKGVGVGCLFLALLMLAGTIIVVVNVRKIAGVMFHSLTEDWVENSSLSEEQKAATIGHIDRFIDAFKSKHVTQEGFDRFLEEFGNSPLMPVAMVKSI